MSTSDRPYNWEDDGDDVGQPAVMVSRQRLAQLSNGTRPLVVHERTACMN